MGYHVERIFFDEKFWILMLKKLNLFYLKAIIPELVSERISVACHYIISNQCITRISTPLHQMTLSKTIILFLPVYMCITQLYILKRPFGVCQCS